jgi:hypothetical protein
MTTSVLPIFARVRISTQPTDGFGVWVPVFLLWPMWFALLALFFVTLLAITAITGSRAYAATAAATRELHLVACGLRGVRCEVQGARCHVSVALI